MRAIFNDESFLAAAAKVEVALARVQGRLGIIPAEAAAAIEEGGNRRAVRSRQAQGRDRQRRLSDHRSRAPDGAALRRGRRLPALRRHHPDIMDTATILLVRDGLALVKTDLAALDTTLSAMAKKHRDTVMAGRTHLQHALPVTFGHKAAVWLSMIRRHRERLDQLSPRVLVGQFAGAAGTLASLGDRGLDVHDALMADLGLGVPSMTWHSARDSIAETVSFLALVTGSLAKIATDVMLMMQTEIAEAFEPFVTGRGAPRQCRKSAIRSAASCWWRWRRASARAPD